MHWWIDNYKTRNVNQESPFWFRVDVKVKNSLRIIYKRLTLADVGCGVSSGGRKECEARQEHLSALRPVWWGVVLVCSRPAQKSAGPVNLAQLCCLFGLTQRSPRGYGSRSLKEAFVLKQEICYKYLPWGECKGLALGQPDCGHKIHCTFLN